MTKLRVVGILLLLGITLSFSTMGNINQSSFNYTNTYLNNKHVLLIGLDGCRADAFLKAYNEVKNKNEYSYFADLIKNGVIDNNIYAGGHGYDVTEQDTFSEPGWTTILTGVWSNLNHITINGDLEKGKFNHNIPTLFNYIRHNIPNAVVIALTDWEPIKLLAGYTKFGDDNASIIKYFPYAHVSDLKSVDQVETQEAIKQINTNDPTFMYIHFDNPDETGHTYGYHASDNSYYVDAIKQDDLDINLLAKAIQASREKGNEWLIILATDHGGHLLVHGTQSWTDKEIFGVFNDPKDARYSGGRTIQAVQGQTTFVPTILNYLGLPSNLYETVSGKVLGQAKPGNIYLGFDIPLSGLENGYPYLVKNKNWPGLEPYADKIISAFYGFEKSSFWDKKYYFFLNDGTYVRYDIGLNKVDAGPLPIASKWPALAPYVNKLVASFYGHPQGKWLDEKYYFLLNDGTYLSFDIYKNKFDKGPLPIASNWPGLAPYVNKIVSVIYGHPAVEVWDEKYYIFLKDGNYLSYDISTNKLDGSPAPIATHWSGLAPYADEIKTAVYGHPPDNELVYKYYFFLKPMPYN